MNVENSTAASIQAVSQILESAQKAAMDQAEKMIKVAVTMAVESPSLEGMGENLDITA